MGKRRVQDLMVSLREYVLLEENRTFLESLDALKRAAEGWPSHLQPPRAVLVVDSKGEVIGQLGHLELLKALEPRYSLLGHLDILSRAGVSEDLLNAVVEGFWKGSLLEACRRAAGIPISKLMRPITESVDQGAPLSEAIHKIVMWQTMRILVTSGGKAVGILRLADVIDEVTNCLLSPEA